jgi:hypothetical protein
MARTAIKTKYIGATHTKGERIKATAMGSVRTLGEKPLSITRPYNYELDNEQNHREVAELLIQPLYNPFNYDDVDIELVAGSADDETFSYVFVAVNKSVLNPNRDEYGNVIAGMWTRSQ